MKTAPCYNCKKRYLGCHDYCLNYLKYKTKREEYLKMRMRQNEEKYDYLEYKEQVMKRMSQ